MIGYECKAPEDLRTYSLVQIGECTLPEVLGSTHNKSIQVLLDPTYYRVPVKSCSVFGTFQISVCTFNHHTSLIKTYDRVIRLSREECERVHFTGEYVFYNKTYAVRRNASTTISVFAKGNRDKTGWCSNEPFTDVTTGESYADAVVEVTLNIILTDYNAQVDIPSGNIILKSGLLCTYSAPNSTCDDLYQGQIYWQKATLASQCDRHYFNVLYSGEATMLTSRDSPSSEQEEYVIVESDRTFAIWLTDTYRFCGLTLYNTEYAGLKILFDIEYFRALDSPTAAPDPMIFYLSKMMYMEYSYKTNLQKLHVHSLQKRCLIGLAQD